VLLLACRCAVVACRVEDLLALRSKLSGLSVLSSSSEEVVLGICLKLPTARQQGAKAAAEGAPVRQLYVAGLQNQVFACCLRPRR
jgi:hypothetical protein